MNADDPRIIIALDYDNAIDAIKFVDSVMPSLCRLKVGKELFVRTGPNFVLDLTKRGFDVFLDLKFNDIPNTVCSAVNAAADMGVWMTDIHASGGRRMMEEAKNSVMKKNSDMLLVAVTVLTSLDGRDLSEIGVYSSPEEQVFRLAALAKESGMDGVVSSAVEAAGLRKSCGDAFVLVTPGIRSASAKTDDQRRILTPEEAVINGSNYLVIGRPITRALDPVAALKLINDDILSVICT